MTPVQSFLNIITLATVFLAISFNSFLSVVKAQNQSLELITLNTSLPTGRRFCPATYDGGDSIYILGGQNNEVGFVSEILKYSIYNDSISVFSNLVFRNYGTGQYAGNNEIFYYGGMDSNNVPRSDILRIPTNELDEDPKNITLVNHLPTATFWASSVFDPDSSIIYVIGGYRFLDHYKIISSYNTKNNSVEIVGELPYGNWGSSAVWNYQDNKVYVFGGSDGHGHGPYFHQILEFDPATGIVTAIPDVSIEEDLLYSCSVWTGTEAYIIGGFNQEEADNSNATYYLIRYNPSTNELSRINLMGEPALEYIYSAGCTFVAALNRIYIFGGYGAEGRYRHEIMYIDLDQLKN